LNFPFESYNKDNACFAVFIVVSRSTLVSETKSDISNITCQILPSFHALTGCDTTSAFFRIWKKYAYKILKTSHEELSDLVSLTNVDHADLPLQLHIRSCKKSDDIIPVKRTGSRPLFPFYQPNSKNDLTDIKIRKL
jgi:hypothetical protein